MIFLLTFSDFDEPLVLTVLNSDNSIFSEIIKKIEANNGKDSHYLKFNNKVIFDTKDNEI